MPLSPSQERELLHSRDIVLRGYRRADGLYDIEAQLTDAKTHGFGNRDRGYIGAGEPIHGMWLRFTLDDTMHIVACEAAMDHTPYTVCTGAAPNFARLAGLQIKPGFLKEAANVLKEDLGVKNLRSHVEQDVFVFPRRTVLAEKVDGHLERPLRAMTMQGPRVTVVRSDTIGEGNSYTFQIKVRRLSKITTETLAGIVSYGELKGLGQWRNGGYGRFTAELYELEDVE